MRASFNQTLEANKNQINKLEELVAEKDRVIEGNERELKIQADKAASNICTHQTRIDELQKSLNGAQNDLKEEMRLKNLKNEEILKISNNLKTRQNQLNHEVKSRVKNIEERDDAISELGNVKTKLENLNRQ